MNYGDKGIKQKKKLLNSATTKLGTKLGIFFIKLALVGIIALVVAGSCLVFGSFQGIIENAPDIASINVSPEGFATKIYDADNNEIQTLSSAGANRTYVTIDQIPLNLQHAFIAIEDERFYEHNGIDMKGILRAASITLSSGHMSQGASTITQQLIKNITGDSEQSPSRKIREIFRAMELERAYSKDKILETYLNYIGFGGTANGLESASQKYFGKSASELDIAEAASLAAIPKSPETMNPFAGYTDDQTGEWVNTGHEKNRNRQKYVLWQMYTNGAITYDQYQQALNEKLIFTDSDEYKAAHPDADKEKKQDGSAATSWIVDAALYEVADYLKDQFNLTTDQAISRINRGGYQIYTTVNLDAEVCGAKVSGSQQPGFLRPGCKVAGFRR